jgi:23S rRNA G2069 N7-methylase RlmK/C1962 C5-methylase RlmI
MLRNRLVKRERHLKKWARRAGTEVYRLYDRDIPEIPLVIDRYGDALAGALYRRPYEKDPEEEERWLSAMIAAISEALGTGRERIFFRERRRGRGGENYSRLGEEGFIREVREGGLLFRVNLSDYLDPGLFPDRRRLRALAGAEAGGKRVLNLFCYTASFSLYAARGGAREIDSVDLSRTYLDRAEENFRLNGFPVRRLEGAELLRPSREGGPPFRLVRAEALNFLAGAERAGLRWDRIILDPPAFSNSKKMEGVLDLRRDHPALISRCLGLLERGGALWFSANPRQFRLDRGYFEGAFPGLEIRELGEELRDEDFRGKRLPRCYRFSTTETEGGSPKRAL